MPNYELNDAVDALLECAVPTELQDGLWRKCEYREAARQVLNDQEVTI